MTFLLSLTPPPSPTNFYFNIVGRKTHKISMINLRINRKLSTGIEKDLSPLGIIDNSGKT